MGRKLHWLIVDITQCLINVLFHGVGLMLLLKIYRRHRKVPQKIILINLALCLLVRNIVHFLHEIIDFFLHVGENKSHFFRESHRYVEFTRKVFCTLQVYSAMFILTGDRLCGIILNIQYPSICTIRRTRILLITTWVVNTITLASLSIVYGVTGYRDFYLFFHRYVDVCFSVLFCLFAAFTYSYIFFKYSKSLVHGTNSTWRYRALSILRDTNYSISILLVLSFLFLTVLPEILATILKMLGKNTEATDVYTSISLLLSDTVDAILYVFFQKPVSKLFMKLFCRCCVDDEDHRSKASAGESSKKTTKSQGDRQQTLSERSLTTAI